MREPQPTGLSKPVDGIAKKKSYIFPPCIQRAAFKGTTYPFHSCETFGNRESHFYQDSTFSENADTSAISDMIAVARRSFLEYAHRTSRLPGYGLVLSVSPCS